MGKMVDVDKSHKSGQYTNAEGVRKQWRTFEGGKIVRQRKIVMDPFDKNPELSHIYFSLIFVSLIIHKGLYQYQKWWVIICWKYEQSLEVTYT